METNKDLLLKDLCARLPYGVKVQYNNCAYELLSIHKDAIVIPYVGITITVQIEVCKPYLFPLSSMTEEQKKELEKLYWYCDNYEICNDTEYVYHTDCSELIDWLNKNHFDYRGLIPMGSAIDATNLNIYNL